MSRGKVVDDARRNDLSGRPSLAMAQAPWLWSFAWRFCLKAWRCDVLFSTHDKYPREFGFELFALVVPAFLIRVITFLIKSLSAIF